MNEVLFSDDLPIIEETDEEFFIDDTEQNIAQEEMIEQTENSPTSTSISMPIPASLPSFNTLQIPSAKPLFKSAPLPPKGNMPKMPTGAPSFKMQPPVGIKQMPTPTKAPFAPIKPISTADTDE